MNKKIQKLVQPSMKLFLAILVIFAVVTLFIEPILAIAEGVLVLLLVIWSVISTRRSRRELLKYIESVTYSADTAKNNTLLNFPMPMAVFRFDGDRIVWANQIFFNLCGSSSPSFEARMTDMIPEFTSKWMLEGKNQYPGLFTVGDRKYQVHGNIIRGSADEDNRDFMGITYWLDVTEYDHVRKEYYDSRPVMMLIVLDNYDEFLKNVQERTRTELRGNVDDKVEEWCSGMQGLVRRFDRDRYLFIFEERHLNKIIENKFSLLDSVRSVVNPLGIHATVSLGLGHDGVSFEENFNFASLSIEMALSRGGDQAVVKNRFNFEFYGGRGTEVETRTKVKSRVMATALSELIRDASQVFVMGHKYGDLDAVGGGIGIACIARKLGRKTYIVIDPDNNAAGQMIEGIQALPEYRDAFITPQDAMLRADSHTLLVVVDTNRPEQVEDPHLLMACNRVALIDHHRRTATYIRDAALTFHEPYASSVCELISELLQELVEQSDILRSEAEAMLAGIVMDTKNFTIRTGERTFDAAAFLRRAGADTTAVKKLLQNDLDSTVARYTILQGAKIYRGSIAIAAPESTQDRVVAAQAADELLNISGVEASIVISPTPQGGVTISARSIGEVNVQVLLEKLGGGGNKSAAGAQIPDMSIRDAVNRVFKAIDEYYDG